MYSIRREKAEAVLRYLCIGAQISGIRFTGPVTVLFEHLAHPRPVNYEDIYLAIESHWGLFPTLPEPMPAREWDLPDLDFPGQLGTLGRLRHKDITDVALARDNPHLLITFNSGEVLIVHGYDEQFECWELGLYEAAQTWLVVATPGGRISFWDGSPGWVPESDKGRGTDTSPIEGRTDNSPAS